MKKLGMAVGVLVALGSLLFAVNYFWLMPRTRLRMQDKSVCTHQIRAAAEFFFLEHGERIFVEYDELVGPDRFIKTLFPVAGEDYHEMFPLRRDYLALGMALGVTMADGRKVIVYTPPERVDNRTSFTFRQNPDGNIIGLDSSAQGMELYRRWLADERKPDGVQVKQLGGLGRFEITYHGGVPDGPFRAYDADGKLWAEATYVKGAVTGRHVIYNASGKIIYQTEFAR